MPLTDTACRNLKCPQGKARERFSDSGGLYLEVVPTGGKHWRWKYRFDGKEKRLALGSYPQVGLATARRTRDDARDLLKLGTDPVSAKKEAKQTDKVNKANNFETVARDWYEHWKGTKTERHAGNVIRRLESDVFPRLGSRPIATITAPQILAMAKAIEVRGALDLAHRMLQTCGQVFRYAVAHGVCERNPASDVSPADALKPKRKVNYARLEGKEVP